MGWNEMEISSTMVDVVFLTGGIALALSVL